MKNDGEVEQMLREAAAKIKEFKEATAARRVETSNREAIEVMYVSNGRHAGTWHMVGAFSNGYCVI